MKTRETKKEDKNTAYVYNILRQMIEQKKLLPGDKFNQVKLAKELKVSRTPIIKALHKLESEGLVDSINQKGFFVHQLTISELAELFALREALEMIVIENLVDNMDSEQVSENIGKLREIFASFNGEWTAEMIEEYKKADVVFHNRLFDLCTNTLAQKINNKFQIINRTCLAGLIRKSDKTFEEHMAIITALENKDAKRAKEEMAEHIVSTRKILFNITDRLGELGIDTKKLLLDELDKDELKKAY